MVRAVVGTLVEVGRHRMTLDDFRRVIEGKQRTQAGESMPAKALFLENVVYGSMPRNFETSKYRSLEISKLQNLKNNKIMNN
jgi:tRNA U38,U39,U40 pseudouridine synthase TruA